MLIFVILSKMGNKIGFKINKYFAVSSSFFHRIGVATPILWKNINMKPHFI
jgi:hypothetical protein